MFESQVFSVLAAVAATTTLVLAIVSEKRQWRSQRYIWQSDQALSALIEFMAASWGGLHNDLYARRLEGQPHLEMMKILESTREAGQYALTRLWLIAPRDVIVAAQKVRNAENAIYEELKSSDVLSSQGWRELKRQQNEARTELINAARKYLGLSSAPSLGIRNKRFDFL